MWTALWTSVLLAQTPHPGLSAPWGDTAIPLPNALMEMKRACVAEGGTFDGKWGRCEPKAGHGWDGWTAYPLTCSHLNASECDLSPGCLPLSRTTEGVATFQGCATVPPTHLKNADLARETCETGGGQWRSDPPPGHCTCAVGSVPTDQSCPPPQSYDVVLVPGCPSDADGSLSFCLWRRAVWAFFVYEDGHAQEFIVSGGPVQTPWAEADMLRAAMVYLGVPAEKIQVERQALHTDENVFYSLDLARSLGWEKIAVASDPGHAGLACELMNHWGEPCAVLPADYVRLHHAMQIHYFTDVTGVTPERDWLSLHARERRLAKEQGRFFARPPSWWVYNTLFWQERPEPPQPYKE
jgi:uncharacterized SAM-binding protein YcdF (DUF218 family)